LEDRCVPRVSPLTPPTTPPTIVTSELDNGLHGTLRWAIANTEPGGTIEIAPYVQNIVLTEELLLDKDLTIAGLLAFSATGGLPEAQAPERTGPPSILGNNTTRIFEVAPRAHVTLYNLILANGHVGGDHPVATGDDPSVKGGAILNFGTLEISQSAL